MRHVQGKCRQWVLVESLEDRLLLSDTTPPTADFTVHSFMSVPQWVAVTFRDNVEVAFRSMHDARIRVQGPGGFDARAFGGWGQGSWPSNRLGYDIPAPGGSWDSSDNGTYKISLYEPIKDTSGNLIRSLKLGQFDVTLSGMGRVTGYVGKDDQAPRERLIFGLGDSLRNAPMKDVVVYVDANEDGVRNPEEVSVLSDAKGMFEFRELPIGNHRIRQEAPAGYQLYKSLPLGDTIDEAGTGGFFDILVKQSEIIDAGSFINSLLYLDVDGTAAADQILVEPDAGGVKVTINGVSEVRSLTGFNALRIRGGDGDDQITIDAGIQMIARIQGQAGNDTLRDGGGNSTIWGGDGRDLIFGGDGADWLAGGDQLFTGEDDETLQADRADTIHGEEGRDFIYGGLGSDDLFGDGGNDKIISWFGNATIHGGDGNDVITCGSGLKVVHGEGGDDRVSGGSDADQLFGDDGNDTLNGFGGADAINGGNGNDALRSQNDDDHDTLNGGSGTDNARVDISDTVLKTEQVKVIRRRGGGSGGGGPFCFLTTAVVHWAGKADDCHELTVLRRFRDGYMRALPDGETMIRDYYEHAPRVVEAIEEQNLGDQEWPRVYAMVQEAVSLIEAGRNREALDLYSAEYLRLKAEYVEAAVV